MAWILRWLTAFALTQCVEMGFYVNAHRAPRPLAERLAIAFGCSAITHPLVWFVVQPAMEIALDASEVSWSGTTAYWIGVLVAESFAVMTEAGFLACFGVRSALRWALAANATSVVLGFYCYLFLDL
ncbi:MAG: hypothetical protein M3Y87_24465 [Myxococcota bacterium]|nr:hypothetical protein [Myxococcota bacterium]